MRSQTHIYEGACSPRSEEKQCLYTRGGRELAKEASQRLLQRVPIDVLESVRVLRHIQLCFLFVLFFFKKVILADMPVWTGVYTSAVQKKIVIIQNVSPSAKPHI